MAQNSSRTAGRHFLQIPGPTPVPDRILRAMDMPVIDHRGPEFGRLGRRVLDGIVILAGPASSCGGPAVIGIDELLKSRKLRDHHEFWIIV